jgi:hypothetical protein
LKGAPAFAEPLRTAVPAAIVNGGGSPVSVLVSSTASRLHAANAAAAIAIDGQRRARGNERRRVV